MNSIFRTCLYTPLSPSLKLQMQLLIPSLIPKSTPFQNVNLIPLSKFLRPVLSIPPFPRASSPQLPPLRTFRWIGLSHLPFTHLFHDIIASDANPVFERHGWLDARVEQCLLSHALQFFLVSRYLALTYIECFGKMTAWDGYSSPDKVNRMSGC